MRNARTVMMGSIPTMLSGDVGGIESYFKAARVVEKAVLQFTVGSDSTTSNPTQNVETKLCGLFC